MKEFYIRESDNVLISEEDYSGINYLDKENFEYFGEFKSIEDAQQEIAFQDYCKSHNC